MRKLENVDCIWSMSDRSESSVVNRGNNRIPHPLNNAISEATSQGYIIEEMDLVMVIPIDEREKSFESAAIMLYNPEKEMHAAIVQTPKRSGLGGLYEIVTYIP